MITHVIDWASMDGEFDLGVARDQGGIVAGIHKATEGRTFTDRGYSFARAAMRLAGLLAGAYHFGRPGDVAAQVDNFLKVVGDDPEVLLALDLEGALDKPTTMSTAEAAQFVDLVHQHTGRWPLLYAGKSKLKERMGLATADERAVLANCALWLAKYGDEPSAPAPWATWSLWQYSDGKPDDGPSDRVTYPRSTPGMHRADRNAFRGDAAALRAWWGAVGR